MNDASACADDADQTLGELAQRYWSIIRKPSAAYPVLVAACALMDVRRTFAFAYESDPTGLFEKLGFVDFQIMAEWGFIVALAARLDFSKATPGRLERLVGLAFAAFALVGVTFHSHAVTVVACLAIALRLALVRALWPLSICLALVSLQFTLTYPPFKSLHLWVGSIDAQFVHLLLSIGGYANEVAGNVLHVAGTDLSVEIMNGCDTATALNSVFFAYSIFTVASGGRVSPPTIVWGLRLIGLVFLLNWIRLVLMCMSMESFNFWHTGWGESILSTAYMMIASSFAQYATTPAKTSVDVAPIADMSA